MLLSILTHVMIYVTAVAANYRHFYIENADVCRVQKSLLSSATSSSKKLSIGSGATIFTLRSPSSTFQPNYGRSKAKRCEIHIKAPDSGYGLMAYVEEMHMRRSTRDNSCVDYIQFGQDDILS